MRVMAIVTDAVAGLSVYWMVSRGWRAPWIAFSALTLFHIVGAVPGARHRVLTNGFGHGVSVVAMALVRGGAAPLPVDRVDRARGGVDAPRLSDARELSHAARGDVDGGGDCVCGRRRRRARRATPAAIGILFVAAALAFTLYYRHFQNVLALLRSQNGRVRRRRA
jgi:hypothetical protein